MFGFIGETSALPVQVHGGQVYVADRPVGIQAEGCADGEATLFFRPQDVDIVNGAGPAIPGVVVATRRHAATRRIDMEVGAGRHRIEVEVPLDQAINGSRRLALRPRRWKLFPNADQAFPCSGDPTKSVEMVDQAPNERYVI